MAKVIGSGVGVSNGLAVLNQQLTNLRASHSVTIPEAANDTLIERIRAPDTGATVARIVVRTVDAVSATAGTYTIACDKESDTGTTVNVLSTATEDLTVLGKKLDTDLTLTGTAANLDFADGDFLKITIASNNADLTGGSGLIVSVLWTKDTYTQPAVSPSEADWIVLQPGQLSTLQDSEPMLTGAITISGDYLQIPVECTPDRSDLNNCLMLGFDIPSETTDQSNGYPLGRLFFEITLGTEFSGRWGLGMGIGAASESAGIASFISRESATDRYALRSRAYTSNVNNINVYIAPTGAQGTLYGSAECWGYDSPTGDMVFISNMQNLDTGEVGYKVQDRDYKAGVNRDNLKLLLCVFHFSSGYEAETLDARVRYAWAPVGFLAGS